MKASFTSVFALAVLFHLPCLVLGAPFAWNNRHYHIARSELAKAEETATTTFVNSTTIADEKATATATKTRAESTASATIINGQSPLQTALTPQITDWNSCQSFLSNSGINLFIDQIDRSFNVVINEVTTIFVLIDDSGRVRESRVDHAFPQPTNYYAEFDQSKNKSGNDGNNGSHATAAKSTVTATATHVTKTAAKAENTSITTTTTPGNAKETAATTRTTTSASAEATSAASETASAANSEETASA